MTLDELRARLTVLDRELVERMAERERLSREVAAVKRATGYPTRDFQRERDVLLRARAQATELGASPDLAEQIMSLLITDSLATQEKALVSARAAGSGKRALVIGGRGKMGGWFAEFLASQGYEVEIADPAGPIAGYAHRADWHDGAIDQDVIVVATPLGITSALLADIARRRPPGLIFDLGSIKTPLRAGLTALRDSGLRVTSLHPMFGPDTHLLSGRHVIFVDLGHPQALAEAQQLFASTMAEQAVMSLDEHDRLIAYVLGLSHAVNIAFFTALAESGEAAPRLAKLSSSTFDAQLDVASRVAAESPALYFEIQALNEYGGESLAALLFAVERLRATVRSGDEKGFAQMMTRGRAYLEGRTSSAPGAQQP